MPLFQYVCEACNTHSEILIRGHETPACPHCGSDRLKKQLSTFAPKMGASGGDAACASASSCSRFAGGCCPHHH